MNLTFYRSIAITLVLILLCTYTPVMASPTDTVATTATQLVGKSLNRYTPEAFLHDVFSKAKIELTGSLKQISQQGKRVSKTSIQTGDILFFGTDQKHLLGAGIYDGQGHVIIAATKLKTIRSFAVNNAKLQPYYLGAIRISSTKTSSQQEAIVQAGLRYLGTPYERGSDRRSKQTMDCSEFVMWAVKDGIQVQLPSSSRTQANYVKRIGKTSSSWKRLQRGDLMFFMEYRGWQLSNYEGIKPANHAVAHVAIYLGNGQILHTYSQESGGVCISALPGTHWEKRFIFGGSAL